MIKQHISLLFLFFLPFLGFNQEVANVFVNEIDSLNKFGRAIIESTTDEEKEVANAHFRTTIEKIANNPASFEASFSDVAKISVLKTHHLKIYNWALPHSNGTYTYFAFLQIRLADESFKVIELIDKSDEIQKPETKTFTDKFWFGALYYELIHDKKLGNDYYTVLGWDGNNLLTNKKIIDVIAIDNKGTVKLGAPIFKMEKNTQRRVIFEYSKNVSMSLKYDAKKKRIVFDYLVPSSSHLKGIYEYYGPSLDSFDALILEKNKWAYASKIDVKLEKDIKKNKEWNDPLK